MHPKGGKGCRGHQDSQERNGLVLKKAHMIPAVVDDVDDFS